MPVGTQETDTATVTGTGVISLLPVHASNPWNGVTPTPKPAITIVKGDANGHAGDTAASAPDLGLAPAAVGLVFRVTNTGNEPLKNIAVTDELVANGTVTGLSCDFSALGGPRRGHDLGRAAGRRSLLPMYGAAVRGDGRSRSRRHRARRAQSASSRAST